MSGTTATVVVNHLSQEVLLLHFGATCVRGLPTSAPVMVLPLVNILRRAIPKMFPSLCQDMHARSQLSRRLNVPGQH